MLSLAHFVYVKENRHPMVRDATIVIDAVRSAMRRSKLSASFSFESINDQDCLPPLAATGRATPRGAVPRRAKPRRAKPRRAGPRRAASAIGGTNFRVKMGKSKRNLISIALRSVRRSSVDAGGSVMDTTGKTLIDRNHSLSK